MLRKKKKFFKILSVLVAVIIAFSLFNFSVSAEIVDPSVELNGMEINQIYISVTSSSGIETSLPVNLYPVLNEDVGYIFVEAVLNGTNLDSNETYILNTTLLTRTYLENYENYVVGSYCVYLDNRYVTPLKSVSSYRAGKKENASSYSHNQKATVSASNKWEREGYKYSFDAGILGVGYDLYSSYIKFKPVDSTRKSLQIYIYNIDFDVISPQEYSGQQIIDNQNKNTDKILNGGSDNPHYNGADTTVTDDYHSKEQEVFNQTASARSSTVNFFNNFGALLNDTPVQRGLLAVSKIMTEFFSIGWLSGIIQFALALGAFAFILGSVIMVVGRLSSRESRSARSEYYKSRSEYYKSRRKK